MNVSEYWVVGILGLLVSEYWGVGIVDSLEINFNGWNIGLSEYLAIGILGAPLVLKLQTNFAIQSKRSEWSF